MFAYRRVKVYNTNITVNQLYLSVEIGSIYIPRQTRKHFFLEENFPEDFWKNLNKSK